jgi:hypothetical protein
MVAAPKEFRDVVAPVPPEVRYIRYIRYSVEIVAVFSNPIRYV